MVTEKQKVLDKDKEIKKRLQTVEAIRSIRRRIAQAHGNFPEINSLIRETREGTTQNNE